MREGFAGDALEICWSERRDLPERQLVIDFA
jgi:hypothetical protein